MFRPSADYSAPASATLRLRHRPLFGRFPDAQPGGGHPVLWRTGPTGPLHPVPEL